MNKTVRPNLVIIKSNLFHNPYLYQNNFKLDYPKVVCPGKLKASFYILH